MDSDSTLPVNESSSARIESLESRCQGLENKVRRLERQLTALSPLVKATKDLHFWDFSVYEARPDASWLAVDRDEASGLLNALAEVDHWEPWDTRIEPRPQS